MIRVEVRTTTEVLFAMEEGLRCAALSAVIGEIWGDPPEAGFTATKRLAMRSETSGVPAWLIRRSCAPDLSAARERWRIASVPSTVHPDDPAAPGAPRWRVELFRSRWRKPGEWVATYDRAAHRLDLAAPLRDGAVAEVERRLRQRANG